MRDIALRLRRWWCSTHGGHEYHNWCPPSCTPFVICRRCGHGGWVL